MKLTDNQGILKRTQKGYTMSFKLSVAKEVESGKISINGALKKYRIQSHGTIWNWMKQFGNFDRELQVTYINAIERF